MKALYGKLHAALGGESVTGDMLSSMASTTHVASTDDDVSFDAAKSPRGAAEMMRKLEGENERLKRRVAELEGVE